MIVGSKLPFGLVIHHPSNPSLKVTLKGLNSSKVIGSTYVITEVSVDFWDAWKAAHKDFKPLTSGAIFEAKGESHANSIAKEQAKRRTGIEPLALTNDPRMGSTQVKPATKD